jgi:hypothetical protein
MMLSANVPKRIQSISLCNEEVVCKIRVFHGGDYEEWHAKWRNIPEDAILQEAVSSP